MERKVTESEKKRVAGRQRYTCAASVPDYECPLGGRPFDEAGYEIDHIVELRNGGTNELTNLQALCPMCHRVKTSRKTSEMARRQPEPEPVRMCYHCSKEGATIYEHGRWSCKVDCIKTCSKLCIGGCGFRSSPSYHLAKDPVAHILSQYAYSPSTSLFKQ